MSLAVPARPRWDVFCKVVDNFGDIGVCWRLARQLRVEHGIAVRLWVDDLTSFARICPRLAALPRQVIDGIEVLRWQDHEALSDVADVVIDAFGCELPAVYLAAMPARTVWVTLEYLSAEAWVRDCHARVGHLAGVAPPRWFFFPGFVEGTGGLIRERDLLARREAFMSDAQARSDLLAQLEVEDSALKVFLFCYDNPALPVLIDAWRSGGQAVSCVLPEGSVATQVSRLIGEALTPGAVVRRGALSVHVIPMVPQQDFDFMLWAMDCNFVRGEDSFVRAQWAARPFAWNIYPQDDSAHLKKLAAFLELFCHDLPEAATKAVRAMMHGWNDGTLSVAQWQAFSAQLPALREHAVRWSDRLVARVDLASSLVQFCAKPV